MGDPVSDAYYQGSQDGYEQALDDVILMITTDHPDPNPLASLFDPYIGDKIIKSINQMKG